MGGPNEEKAFIEASEGRGCIPNSVKDLVRKTRRKTARIKVAPSPREHNYSYESRRPHQEPEGRSIFRRVEKKNPHSNIY